jgi:heme A synthase
MKRLHLILGIIVLVVFLFTGAYMDAQQPPVRLQDGATRMMFRSRHIYVLFAALLNLSLGVYFVSAAVRWRRTLQHAGSGFIIAATVLLIAAFFYEARLPDLPRFFTTPAIALAAIGTLVHLASTVKFRA